MGARSRRKGCAAELVVRDRIRAAFPQLPMMTVRRSSQAERAYESDLIIEGPGVPSWILKLWTECEHANNPDPVIKYAQAVRDAERWEKRMQTFRTPIVCWRKTGSRTIWLSTSMANLNHLLYSQFTERGAGEVAMAIADKLLVTVDLDLVLHAMSVQVPVV
jgi:hypothetical protein